jgi:Polyketide cyclase / dehydrase and lipid transport
MPAYTYRQNVDAPRAVVFDVLADRLGYAQITPLRSVELVRSGAEDSQGVGAVHRLGLLGPLALLEQVTLIDRPARYEYRVIGGAPVREHTGVITLTENADGSTAFEYTMDSTASLPLPAFMVTPVLRLMTRLLADGVAAEAARRAKAE